MNLMWKKVSYDFTLRVRPPTHRSSKVTRRVADEANHLAREALTPEKCEHPYVNSLENLDSINAIDFTLLIFFDELTIARCMTDRGRTFTSPVKTHKLLEFSPDGARWPRRGGSGDRDVWMWSQCDNILTVAPKSGRKEQVFSFGGGGGGCCYHSSLVVGSKLPITVMDLPGSRAGGFDGVFVLICQRGTGSVNYLLPAGTPGGSIPSHRLATNKWEGVGSFNGCVKGHRPKLPISHLMDSEVVSNKKHYVFCSVWTHKMF